MAKKRKSRSSSPDAPKPATILWVLLVVNVVLGLLYSRITAIRKVRVEGAYSWDQPRLEKIAQGLKGIPCAQINPNRVGSDVMADPDVYGVDLDRNLFGSAVIRLSYRNPVAMLADEKGVAITIDGLEYPSEHLDPALPKIKLQATDVKPDMTLAGPLNLAAIAKLVAKSEEIAGGLPISVEVGDGREVCLNIGTGRVKLGSSDGLDAKMSLLKDQLKKDPNMFSRVEEINLTVPSVPTQKSKVVSGVKQ